MDLQMKREKNNKLNRKQRQTKLEELAELKQRKGAAEVDGDILFDEQDATRLTILVNARLLKTENTKKISIVKGVLEVSATVRLSRKSGK
jgi:hypothetical protein